MNRSPMSSGPNGTGNGDRQSPATPDSPGDSGEEDNSTRNGFGEPTIGVIHTSGPIGPCDAHGSPPPLCQFVCVYQPGPSGPGSEFGNVFKWTDANAPGDAIAMSAGFGSSLRRLSISHVSESTVVLCCEEVIALPFCSPGVTFRMDCRESEPLGGWFTATREQTVFDTWIRSQWEPGGTMFLMGCHQEGALGLWRDPALKMDIDLFSRSSDLVDSFDLLLV